mmetsp:Transcript_21931/g.46895  ORF Transcript_21931/g.46895 Transcript_21931/m.46895 type:complete len:433 (-) Transcript_21931:8-1306(-)
MQRADRRLTDDALDVIQVLQERDRIKTWQPTEDLRVWRKRAAAAIEACAKPPNVLSTAAAAAAAAAALEPAPARAAADKASAASASGAVVEKGAAAGVDGIDIDIDIDIEPVNLRVPTLDDAVEEEVTKRLENPEAPNKRLYREIQAEVEAQPAAKVAKLVRAWEKDVVVFSGSKNAAHYQLYMNRVAARPHEWWTNRLAGPKKIARYRAAMAKANEVILTVAVCNGKGNKIEEFDVLGSQRLWELRDAFYFPSDWMFDGPTRTSSACFFIDGVFYVDRRRENHVDYAAGLIEWIQETQPPEESMLRSDEAKSMNLRFRDLQNIPFGQKCIYIHQGDLEKNFYFTGMRLLNSHDDCPFREAYPILTFMRRWIKRKCYACVQKYAIWVVVDSPRCPYNPSYWCSDCLQHFFKEESGEWIGPLDYKIFPYLHEG